MNRDNDRQTSVILSLIGIVPVVWLALLIAPSVKGGLPEILPSLMNVMNDPFHIELCEDSVKTVLTACRKRSPKGGLFLVKEGEKWYNRYG